MLRKRRWQLAAIGLLLAGIGVLTTSLGGLYWIPASIVIAPWACGK